MKYVIVPSIHDMMSRTWLNEGHKVADTYECSVYLDEKMLEEMKELKSLRILNSRQGTLLKFSEQLENESVPSLLGKRIHIIDQFYVTRNFRNKGLGKVIMRAIEEELKRKGMHICLIRLWEFDIINPFLAVDKEGIIRFFKGEGYELFGKNKEVWLIKEL